MYASEIAKLNARSPIRHAKLGSEFCSAVDVSGRAFMKMTAAEKRGASLSGDAAAVHGDFRRNVRWIPNHSPLTYHNPDLQAATKSMQDVFQKAKSTSLAYKHQEGGPICQVKDLLCGGARGCTGVLAACREALLLPPREAHQKMEPHLPPRRFPRVSPPEPLPFTMQLKVGSQQWPSQRAQSSGDASSAASLASIADVGTWIVWISPTPVKVDGHFCDVLQAIHSRVGKVALKRPRIGAAGYNEDVIRRFQREAATWERLQHPHILEYLGTFQRDGHFYFVSPFVENGTLVEYIVLYPSVNRVKLLCETADAISYLHGEEVVHGDIKASNILIGDNGQVLLCDFGLTKTTDLRTSTAMKGAGTLRWQSPELWNGGSRSFKTDVYAFGMTIAEVLTGQVPLPDLQTEGAVICAVLIEGRRPPKNPTESSAGLSYEKVWAVAEACWPTTPEERISMSEAWQSIQEDPAFTAIQDI